MRTLEFTAVVKPDQTLLETLALIAEKRGGAAFVVNETGHLVGIFTDGDLKRRLMNDPSQLDCSIHGVMKADAKSTLPTDSLEVALDKMRSHHINCLAVLDTEGVLLGHLDIQDVA